MSGLKRTLARKRERLVKRGDESRMQPQTIVWVRKERERRIMLARLEKMKEGQPVEQKQGR